MFVLVHHPSLQQKYIVNLFKTQLIIRLNRYIISTSLFFVPFSICLRDFNRLIVIIFKLDGGLYGSSFGTVYVFVTRNIVSNKLIFTC